jgi:hypothetical protein
MPSNPILGYKAMYSTPLKVSDEFLSIGNIAISLIALTPSA